MLICLSDINFVEIYLQEDVTAPQSLIQDIIWATLHKVVEPILSHWPGSMLRERALKTVMKHAHYDDENTRYICMNPNSKVRKRHTA